jgi:uncharacterized membrane protein YgdD (TMEM256/DUF423 family)
MARRFSILAALLALTGVAIGAFGSHGLSAHFEANPDLEPTFQTASEYHLIHAVGLFAVAWAASRWPGRAVQWAGYLLVAGTVLFSGSLYGLSIANVRAMGAIAPLGGAALLAGWGRLAWSLWRAPDSRGEQ